MFSTDAPEIHLSRADVVYVGSDVSLNCTADGNPEPVVELRFTNQIKATGRRQTMLSISEAKLSNSGEYTCTATNEVGKRSSTTSLRVKGESDVTALNAD